MRQRIKIFMCLALLVVSSGAWAQSSGAKQGGEPGVVLVGTAEEVKAGEGDFDIAGSTEQVRQTPGSVTKRCDMLHSVCRPDGTGALCTNDDQCNDILYKHCNTSIQRCMSGGTGKQCSSDEVCKRGYFCDPESPGKCVLGASGRECKDNSDCPTKVCHREGGPGYGSPLKCVPLGLVFPGEEIIWASCSSDSDCTSLKTCTAAGKCRALQTNELNYFPCKVDDDCDRKACLSLGDHAVCTVAGLSSMADSKPCYKDEQCATKHCNGRNRCEYGVVGKPCRNNRECGEE